MNLLHTLRRFCPCRPAILHGSHLSDHTRGNTVIPVVDCGCGICVGNQIYAKLYNCFTGIQNCDVAAMILFAMRGSLSSIFRLSFFRLTLPYIRVYSCSPFLMPMFSLLALSMMFGSRTAMLMLHNWRYPDAQNPPDLAFPCWEIPVSANKPNFFKCRFFGHTPKADVRTCSLHITSSNGLAGVGSANLWISRRFKWCLEFWLRILDNRGMDSLSFWVIPSFLNTVLKPV